MSTKEEMAIILHYVDTRSPVVERAFGLIYHANTNTAILKAAIEPM